ncbi:MULTISPECIES: hypothetical protein [unclassified Luteococcus]|uniref:hypothetical protein n=1 Tax=unclassified Luteococcus TaxID=2639923 RepID=UPI00313AD386
MIESRDHAVVEPLADGGQRDVEWVRPLAPRFIPVALAVITALLFGVGCTLLGLSFSKLAQPCPAGCTAWSRERLALTLMTTGPGVISVASSLTTLWRVRAGRNQAWLCSVLGCLGAVVCVALGSALLGIF